MHLNAAGMSIAGTGGTALPVSLGRSQYAVIVGDLKPIEEIEASIRGRRRVMILGCRGCVTVCSTGGEKEVAVLASQLRIAGQARGQQREIREATIERQCDFEYIEPLLPEIEDLDVILSLACGAGVQHVAEVAAGLQRPVQVVPAVNTTFLGAALEQGVWAERCQGCGDCVLEITGGICPIARLLEKLAQRSLRRLLRGQMRDRPRGRLRLAAHLRPARRSGKAGEHHPRAAHPQLVHQPRRRSPQARRGGVENMK